MKGDRKLIPICKNSVVYLIYEIIYLINYLPVIMTKR